MPTRLTVADAAVALHADWAGFQREVAAQGPGAVDRAVKPLGARITNALGPNGITKAFTAAGGGAAALFAGAIKGSVDFEDQLRTINTVAHLTDAELDGVGKSILDLSKETGKSTDDLTAGFYDLVSAGVPAKDAINVLRDSAKFATGALGTTGEAVDVVTSALNAYGLEANQSAHVTDVFAQAVADGKVTAAELGSSIANIAPIAASAGISLQEVSAGYAMLTAKGVPAAQAATQMRAAISALLTPNTQLNDIQEKTGINFAELAKAKGLSVALDELSKATGGNADAFAKSLGSIEAYQFALAVTGDNQGAFQAELAKTNAAWTDGGVAQAQYDERMKSAKAQGDKWLAGLKALAIEIGGPFTSVLGPAVSLLAQFGQATLLLTSTGLGGLLGKGLGKIWGGVAGSAVLKSIIGRAGSAAATAYLSALIAGDGIQAALKGAWSAVTNSSVVQSATGAAGKFMGSRLGQFAAVALAAVLVVEAINTYNQIKEELGKQGEDIGNHVGEQIATGSVESLEQSKGALEKGIQDLAEVHDFGIFTNDARRNLQAQLDAVNAELVQRADSIRDNGREAGVGWTKGIGAGASSQVPELTSALTKTLADAITFDDRARGEARSVGGQTGAAVAQGLRDSRESLDQGWQVLLDALKNVEQPAVRAAHLAGRLASKELAKGLSDSRPEVRADAEAVFLSTTQELNKIVQSGGSIGKKGMDALRAAMKSKNPAVREAASLLYATVERNLNKIPPKGTEAGKGVTKNLKDQIVTGTGPVGTAAFNLGSRIAHNMLQALANSGAHVVVKPGQAPIAYDVGSPYIPYDQVALIHEGERILTREENAAVSRGEAYLGVPQAGGTPDQGPGGTVVQNFNLTVDGLIEAHDSLEVAREMRRVARFGAAPERPRPSRTAGSAAA